jgi:hypothetical protein
MQSLTWKRPDFFIKRPGQAGRMENLPVSNLVLAQGSIRLGACEKSRPEEPG